MFPRINPSQTLSSHGADALTVPPPGTKPPQRNVAAKSSARAWLSTLVVAVVGVLGLGVSASPALGATYTLNLSAPATAPVGQPTIIQATGSNPPDDFFSSYLDVAAIPTSVLPTCPSGYLNASQVARSAYAQGGETLATAQREDVDSAGNFSMPIGYAPRMPGQFLICGYTNDGATTTLATASLVLTVQGAGAGATPPAAESDACLDAQEAVKKARKKLRKAKDRGHERRIKKAKKKLKKAKQAVEDVCVSPRDVGGSNA